MKEILIDKNSENQRLDRFLRKFLDKASLSFLYKQIRKKNIVVNDQKAEKDYILKSGDTVKIYFSDETIEKFRSDKKYNKNNIKLNIIYEDENILIINKPAGILSHSTDKNREKNIVDSMIHYLMEKGEYVPRREDTFTPCLANRLDRNTSGILIGAKNYAAIKDINQAQKKNLIKKYYYTIVAANVTDSKTERAAIKKIDGRENMVRVSDEEIYDSKKIVTAYKSLKTNGRYSLLEIDLITGRTHQIRAHLKFLKMPVIGDKKYGDSSVNEYFEKKYKLNNQLLHCHKCVFYGLEELAYLNGREFEADFPKKFEMILKNEF